MALVKVQSQHFLTKLVNTRMRMILLQQLEWIAKTDPRLYRAYKLKEALRLVVYNDTVEEAKEALDAWFKWARHCRIPAFVELQKKINRHKQSILNTI